MTRLSPNFKETGAFDPATLGAVSNVGLMAKKAEEYGSHPTTFMAPADGRIRFLDAAGHAIHEQALGQGDIWRASMTRRAPIRDWIQLALDRARATGAPTVFWLDRARAHDAQIIERVEAFLGEQDTGDLDLRIMPPREAMRWTLQTIREGQDVIAVTGNVLRGLFDRPLSDSGDRHQRQDAFDRQAPERWWPLRNGAGGSAPKHVEQLMEEGHLRWIRWANFARWEKH